MTRDQLQHGQGSPNPSARLIAAIDAYSVELRSTMAEIERRDAERASLESAHDRALEECERPAPRSFVLRIFDLLMPLEILGFLFGLWFVVTEQTRRFATPSEEL